MARGDLAPTTARRPRGGSLPTPFRHVLTPAALAHPGARRRAARRPPPPRPVSDTGTTERTTRPLERAALPTAVTDLPPMDHSFDALLVRGLEDLGLSLDGTVLDALRDHARLLAAWDTSVNLTAIREPAEVARLHVVDGLAAMPLLAALAPPHPSLLDLGAGAGYPGLPLALALPAGRLALVDSVAKKARFLEAAVGVVAARLEGAGLPVPPTEVHACRAEALAASSAHREAWDVVTARALGSLAEVLELALPLLRTGGLAVAWKRADAEGRLEREVDDAAGVSRAAGGARPEVHAARTSLLPRHVLVVVRKTRATPARFPRPPAERRGHRAGRQMSG